MVILNSEQCRQIPNVRIPLLLSQVFLDPGDGFCKNLGMCACVNVMLHPMGWGGHHITCAQNGGKFFKQTLHVFRHGVRNGLRWGWLSCLQNRTG